MDTWDSSARTGALRVSPLARMPRGVANAGRESRLDLSAHTNVAASQTGSSRIRAAVRA